MNKTISILLSALLIGTGVYTPVFAQENYLPYTLKESESIQDAAETFGVTLDSIKAVNPEQPLTAGSTVNILTGFTEYKVQPNDTLYKIAKQFHVKTDMIKLYSNITADEISQGQILRIPEWKGIAKNRCISHKNGSIGQTLRVYTVQPNDTPWSIAIEHGIPVRELLASNGYLADANIPAGVNLAIPVHIVPVQGESSVRRGEQLEWYTAAQYVLPIDRTAKIHDLETGKTFSFRRTGGTVHADCEPLTIRENRLAQAICGGYSEKARPVIVEADGRYIAAAMSYYPHGVSYLCDNEFDGHFNLYFAGSAQHQNEEDTHVFDDTVRTAAGL